MSADSIKGSQSSKLFLQVDAFRWDIMGHLMMSNMHKVLEALGELTLEADGVDSAAIQQYAEAW